MSVVLYLISFILFLSLSIFSSSVIWGVGQAGVPTLYLGIGALVIFGFGALLLKSMPYGENSTHSED